MRDNIERRLLEERLRAGGFDAAMSAAVRGGAPISPISPVSPAKLPADAAALDAELGGQLGVMSCNCINTIEREPYSNSRLFGWALVLLRKLSRRLVLRQFAEDAVDQQNRFNESSMRAAAALGEKAAQTRSAVDAVAAKQEAQQRQLAEQTARLTALDGDRRRSAAEMQTLIEKQQALLEERLGRQLDERLERIEATERALAKRTAALAERTAALEGQQTALREVVGAAHGVGSGEYSEKTAAAVSGWLRGQQAALSASQAGEDGVISYVLSALGIPEAERNYLDVGANHAVALSNTFRFYAAGASGVLVEANPVLADELRRMRPRDTVVCRCVVEKPTDEPVTFYILNGDGLSSTDRAAVDAVLANNPALAVEQEARVAGITADGLIKEFMPEAPAVLSLDIEGAELAFLRGVDWEAWRPAVVVLETIDYDCTTIFSPRRSEAADYLLARDYVEYAFTGINTILVDRRAFDRSGKGDAK